MIGYYRYIPYTLSERHWYIKCLNFGKKKIKCGLFRNISDSMEENNCIYEMHILEIILPLVFDRSKYMKMPNIQIILNSREIS